MVRMVSHSNLTANISVDVGHYFIDLNLKTRNDHDAYGLHTVSYSGVKLRLDARVHHCAHGLP